jgi:hypothetical protein
MEFQVGERGFFLPPEIIFLIGEAMAVPVNTAWLVGGLCCDRLGLAPFSHLCGPVTNVEAGGASAAVHAFALTCRTIYAIVRPIAYGFSTSAWAVSARCCWRDGMSMTRGTGPRKPSGW